MTVKQIGNTVFVMVMLLLVIGCTTIWHFDRLNRLEASVASLDVQYEYYKDRVTATRSQLGDLSTRTEALELRVKQLHVAAASNQIVCPYTTMVFEEYWLTINGEKYPATHCIWPEARD